MKGIVLDTGALIALERGDRSVLRLLERTRSQGRPVHVPAGCLAQAWRDGSRQVAIGNVLKHTLTVVEPLDRAVAKHVGELLAVRGAADVVDGHVAVVAVRTAGTVITSDPDDLRRLLPGVPLVTV